MECVRVGVGLYLLNEKDQLLLGLRKSKHGGNTWCPPGGHLEVGESFEEAAVREAKEETSLDISHEDVLMVGCTNDIFKETGKHYVTIHLMSRRFVGQPIVAEHEKCERWEWFDLDHLPHNMFLPAANFLKSEKDKLKLQKK